MNHLPSTSLRVIEFVAPGVEAIADERGLFAEHGVQVETIRTRSSTEQRERIMSDDCDVALTAIDNLLAWDAAGDDLRIVGQVERTTVLDLVARDDLPDLASLRGQTLAVDAVDTGFAIALRKILRDNGLGDDDYALHAAGGIHQRFEAITQGQAAAGLLGPPWSTQALDLGCRRLTTVEDALPDFPGIGVAVRASRLDELHDGLSRYLAALADAAAWVAAASRDEALAVMTQAGFDPGGAAALLDVVPADVRAAEVGVDLLYEIRRELGVLPDAAPGRDELLVEIGA